MIHSSSPKPDRHREVIDNYWEITTPENISFQYRIGGPFRRLIAFGSDVLLTQVLYWIVIVLTVWLFSMFAGLTGVVGSGITDLIGAIFVLVAGVGSFVVTWFYGAFAETYFNGQTLGKRWMSLRVLSVDGKSVDGSQAVLRNFFRAIDVLPTVPFALLFGEREEEFNFFFAPTFVVALILMTINRRFRRVGDLVAGTVVVSEDSQHQIQLSVLENLDAVRRLAVLIPNDFAFSRTFLLALAAYVNRRSRLSQDRVREIASRLAPQMIGKLRLPPNTDHDLLLCALYYRAFFSDDSDDEPLPRLATNDLSADIPGEVRESTITV
jgi:uncharacterized RDD family membrane protein YckC